jgi:hypothetical protein
MNQNLLYRLARQHDEELRAQAAESRRGRTALVGRVAHVLGGVFAWACVRERVATQVASAPSSGEVPQPSAPITISRRDRPGRALAWRRAHGAGEESSRGEQDRDRPPSWPRDLEHHPLAFVERCDE